MPSTSYTQRTGSAGSRPVPPVEHGERLPRGTLVLGFWAAVATAVTYLIFEIGLLLDPIMPSPWNVWVPIGASALIAPSFLLLTVGVAFWFRRDAHDDLPLPVRDPSWEVGDFHGAMVFDPATRPRWTQPVVPRSSGKSSAR